MAVLQGADGLQAAAVCRNAAHGGGSLALKYGHKPVGSISKQVGYVHHTHFDGWFKNHFGISPRTMRARQTLMHV